MADDQDLGLREAYTTNPFFGKQGVLTPILLNKLNYELTASLINSIVALS